MSKREEGEKVSRHELSETESIWDGWEVFVQNFASNILISSSFLDQFQSYTGLPVHLRNLVFFISTV